MAWFGKDDAEKPAPAPAAPQPAPPELTPAEFEQAVRRRAYLIWEYEGRPSGQEKRHWAMATEAVLAGTDPSSTSLVAKLQFRSELAEVQLLLDFISGRSDRNLEFAPIEAASVAGGNGKSGGKDDDTTKVTQDELKQIATMRFPPVKTFGENAADAVLLALVRDKLNRAVKPASGLTVAFTLLTWDSPIRDLAMRIFGRRDKDDWARRELARQAYPRMGMSLFWFTLTSWLLVLIGALTIVLTLGLSIEIADGQALIKSFQTAQATFGTPASGAKPGAAPAAPDERLSAAQRNLDQWWDDYLASPIATYSCWTLRKLESTHARESSLCMHAEIVPGSEAAGTIYPKEYASIANTLADVAGFELPMFYAIIGSIVAALRCIYDKVSTSTLAPWDTRLIWTRIILGVMAAACIGLFFAPTGTALPGSSVGNLSLSGVAFLAGYAVNNVFQLLDQVIKRVFAYDDSGKSKPG